PSRSRLPAPSRTGRLRAPSTSFSPSPTAADPSLFSGSRWTDRNSLALSLSTARTRSSPAEMLITELRTGGAHWSPLRLNNIVFWGEPPHSVAIAMLPLAFLFLHRAIVRGGA